jgi:hypothetical protein
MRYQYPSSEYMLKLLDKDNVSNLELYMMSQSSDLDVSVKAIKHKKSPTLCLGNKITISGSYLLDLL